MKRKLLSAALMGAVVAVVAVSSCSKKDNGGGTEDPTAGIDFNGGGTYTPTTTDDPAALITAANNFLKTADKLTVQEFGQQKGEDIVLSYCNVSQYDKPGKKTLFAEYAVLGNTEDITKMGLIEFEYLDGNAGESYSYERQAKDGEDDLAVFTPGKYDERKFKRSVTPSNNQFSYDSDFISSGDGYTWSITNGTITGTRTSSSSTYKYEITLNGDKKYKSAKRTRTYTEDGTTSVTTTKFAYDANPKLLLGSAGDYKTPSAIPVTVKWGQGQSDTTINVDEESNSVDLSQWNISYREYSASGESSWSSLSVPSISGQQVTGYKVGSTIINLADHSGNYSTPVTAAVTIEAVWGASASGAAPVPAQPQARTTKKVFGFDKK